MKFYLNGVQIPGREINFTKCILLSFENLVGIHVISDAAEAALHIMGVLIQGLCTLPIFKATMLTYAQVQCSGLKLNLNFIKYMHIPALTALNAQTYLLALLVVGPCFTSPI